MQTLNIEQIDAVSGGVDPVTVGIAVAVAVGGLLAFAYAVGQDLADRDNRLECPAPKQH
jgi:hypothetical protein